MKGFAAKIVECPYCGGDNANSYYDGFDRHHIICSDSWCGARFLDGIQYSTIKGDDRQ